LVNYYSNWFIHDSNQITCAARLSGSKLDAMEELDTENEGIIGTYLNRIKRWFLSHCHYLNFLTILALASVSNVVL
jgi:hypothetical protein